jgi:HTH-type transcriptional regulator, competence development regulator
MPDALLPVERRNVEKSSAKGHTPQSLGAYLRTLRARDRLTLREVEEATQISNAYLSQLETEKIAKPSPHILHTLADFYGVAYEILMEKAGYIKRVSGDQRRSGRLAASSLGDLSREEEEDLLKYLSFIRSTAKKRYEKT